ncbi:methyltransferase domain-containing protein [Streptomyces cinnabarinus]|uniref:Methyltransferase domain-containing protein n=1 Tax=Streptomyces cinnabarinus TaxID=67287 RepID=A0ABY7KNX0_9ACTN|nr:methyltransferase domain-containing protein [Streptomyces cinnabarinus]WAZ26267.1 methyltransferase domain-containing protein [Streptomyces cinnabarinus]
MSTASTTHLLVVELAPREGPFDPGAELRVRMCRTWAGDPVPAALGDAAGLVVMGETASTREKVPVRPAELTLLRTALEAEVPVLGVGEGAELLTRAAGGEARPGAVAAAWNDPLFAGVPDAWRVPHGSSDNLGLRAFRIGGSAWGIEFRAETADAVTSPADAVLPRFAALVASRAARSATRTFFTPKAAAWEERFAVDGPRYAAAVARMGLCPGQRALDVGCGSGRALPALRTEVGAEGLVLGVELTPAMLTATAKEGRSGLARLLMADACRLPLAAGAVDGVFSAGLINHVPDPAQALGEWARVTARDGVLLLYHPSGRAERAARHGRPLDPSDPLAEENLRPALHAAGWSLACCEDARSHFLARAVRVT